MSEQLAADDDERCFQRRWLPVQASVMAYVLAHGVSRQDAEDVLQNIALAVYRSLERYDETRAFEAWVMGIARHKVCDYHRRTPLSLWPLLSGEARQQLEQAAIRLTEECDHRVWAMHECVHQLGHTARCLVERYYHWGESVAQIANALRLTTSNVKVRLHRIRKSLRGCVETRITPRAGS